MQKLGAIDSMYTLLLRIKYVKKQHFINLSNQSFIYQHLFHLHAFCIQLTPQHLSKEIGAWSYQNP